MSNSLGQFLRGVIALLLVIAPLKSVRGQIPAVPPGMTQEQIEAAIRNPAFAAQIRSRIASSGMTADQIRARLRTAGYPDTLLNAFLPGSADSTALPTSNTFSAITFLGLIDKTQQDSVMRLAFVRDSIERASATTSDTAGLKSPIYGLDIFRRATSQFEPSLAGPVDASYRLGPQDVLVVMLTGDVELSYTLELTREGFVAIPQVGQVYLANLTLAEATEALFQRFRRVYSRLGRGPSASTKLFVTVGRLRVNQVFVVGDVQTPGSYQVSGAGTMLTALYAAGGPTDDGGLRDVQLRRGGRVISRFDLYRYIVEGDVAPDARLETGDVVFVPVHGPRVRIEGEIVRPSIYEMRPGESLQDLIRLAGGFTAAANPRHIVINRIVPPLQRSEGGFDRTVLTVSAIDSLGESSPPLSLADGDSVQVLKIADLVRNQVAVLGAVWSPGPVGFRPGMRLSDVVRLAGGVRPDVKSIQVSRRLSDQSRAELRAQFSDSLGNLRTDFPVQEGDSITVFGTSDFRPDRFVSISGAVREPGSFPWREGMTLRDLLHYAGGLEDGAYLDRAEIARVPADRTAGALSITVPAQLDSTYLFERGLDGTYRGPAGLPAKSGGTPEIPMRPYDVVTILQQPSWSLDHSVFVLGQVTFPGQYELRSTHEKLADVVRRAGGPTPLAYPPGTVLIRTSSRVGRIALDFVRALRDTAFRDNLIMEPGDTLIIPEYRSVVDVRGAVNSPIAIAFKPGANMQYYIDAAGGVTYKADRGRAYVQQPNGAVEPYKGHWWRPNAVPEPQPGAVVYVPVQDPDARKDWTAIVGTAAQILSAAATVLVVISRL